jgi:Undecaprenyl-phosphate galactose phosphotransferase WbaP
MSSSSAIKQSIQRELRPFEICKSRPVTVSCIVVLTDLVSLFAALCVAFYGWRWVGADLYTALYLETSLTLLTFPFVYAAMGLYPGYAISPVEEFRRLTLSTSCAFTVLAGMVFLSRSEAPYSRVLYLVTWVFSLATLPLGRFLARKYLRTRDWWGIEVVIIGAGKAGQAISQQLFLNRSLGLKPVGFIDEHSPIVGRGILGLPITGTAGSDLSNIGKRRWAILAMPEISRRDLMMILERYAHCFQKTLIVPDLVGIGSLWVGCRDLDGWLALELNDRLASRVAAVIKRVLDVALACALGPFCLALCIVAAIAIKIDSPGPVLYRHRRVGSGRSFEVFKFRSMKRNAETELTKYFAGNSEIAREWAISQKVKNDPRITRVGRFLRRTSLDELPQIINVLRGEMSFVGPRPIVEAEVEKYGDKYALYSKVKPGITGLWQVSGRNDTTYEDRLRLDEYYVRNWSVWLDLYVIARTVSVVFRGVGAY